MCGNDTDPVRRAKNNDYDIHVAERAPPAVVEVPVRVPPASVHSLAAGSP